MSTSALASLSPLDQALAAGLPEFLRPQIAAVAVAMYEHAGLAEELGYLPEPIVSAIESSGLSGALYPRELGGANVDPMVEFQLIKALSAIDGTVGWTFMIGSGSGARLASMMPDETLQWAFGAEALPMVAFHVDSRRAMVRPCGSGFVVDGLWSYGTAIAHGRWAAGLARGGHDDDVYVVLIDVDQLELERDWNPTGLRGSASWRYRARAVEVPPHQCFSYTSRSVRRGGEPFLMKRGAVKHLGFNLGVGRHVLSAATDLMSGHVRLESDSAIASNELALVQLGRLATELDAADCLARDRIDRCWTEIQATGHLSRRNEVALGAAATCVSIVAQDVAQQCARLAGGAAIARDCAVQVGLRDLITAGCHLEVAISNYVHEGRECVLERGVPL